jgi:hypothetical protein
VSVTLAQQIACVRRELAMRKNVYAKRVADHKMRQGEADLELAAMAAVLSTLEGLEQDGLGQLRFKQSHKPGCSVFAEPPAACDCYFR